MYPAQFAAVYDRLMDDVDYPAWADYYRALLSRARDGAPVRKVCECGCGTGSMTVELARAGLEVVGVDLSAPMLEIAGDKLRRAGVSAPLVCQDMCRLQLHRPVDALVCPCDGVNYLVEDSQVAAFFRRAYALLKPGGALAFDVSTPGKLFALEQAPGYEDREELTYLWVSARRGNLVDMSLTFFLRQGGGLYRRFDEVQCQRAHTQEELRAQLEKAGFEGITFYGDRTFAPPQPAQSRWHVTAVRPREG